MCHLTVFTLDLDLTSVYGPRELTFIDLFDMTDWPCPSRSARAVLGEGIDFKMTPVRPCLINPAMRHQSGHASSLGSCRGLPHVKGSKVRQLRLINGSKVRQLALLVL